MEEIPKEERKFAVIDGKMLSQVLILGNGAAWR